MNRGCVEVTDWDGNGWEPLRSGVLPRLAGLDPSSTCVERVAPHPTRQGRDVRVVSVYFDRDRVRDSWVHGWACDAGYVASVK